MDRKIRFPSRPCCPDCRRTWDQFDTRYSIPASHSFISHLLACEAVQICASATFLLSEGHSAFPDQRMALFSSRFQCAENPLLCPSRAKGAHFAGIFAEHWLLFVNLKRRKTAWWTKSRANHSPPPNSVNKSNLGPNWSNLPSLGMRPESGNDCIGDNPRIESLLLLHRMAGSARYSGL